MNNEHEYDLHFTDRSASSGRPLRVTAFKVMTPKIFPRVTPTIDTTRGIGTLTTRIKGNSQTYCHEARIHVILDRLLDRYPLTRILSSDHSDDDHVGKETLDRGESP